MTEVSFPVLTFRIQRIAFFVESSVSLRKSKPETKSTQHQQEINEIYSLRFLIGLLEFPQIETNEHKNKHHRLRIYELFFERFRNISCQDDEQFTCKID